MKTIMKTLSLEFFEILDKNEMENTKVIKADVVVSDEKVINISDKTIKIIPTKLTAHTKDDLIVYLPDEKLFLQVILL